MNIRIEYLWSPSGTLMNSVSQDLLGVNNCPTSGIWVFHVFVAMQHVSLLTAFNSPWENGSFSVCEKPQVLGHLGCDTIQGLPDNANLGVGVPNSVSFVPVDRYTDFKGKTFLSDLYKYTSFPVNQVGLLSMSCKCVYDDGVHMECSSLGLCVWTVQQLVHPSAMRQLSQPLL